MGKTPPEKVEFELWLVTTKRVQNKCKTCCESPDIITAIYRYWERSQSGVQVPSQAQLHDFICTNYNYPWTLAAMANHLRNCLQSEGKVKSE